MIHSTSEEIQGLKEKYNLSLKFVEQHVFDGNGGKTALHYEDQQLSYNDVLKNMNKFGSALLGKNVEPENRILLAAYDSPEFVTSFFGAIKVGAVPIPVNPMMKPHDYEYFLNNSKAKIFVVERNIWDKIKDNRSRFLFLRHVIVISDDYVEDPNVEDFHHFMEGESSELDGVYTIAEDPAFWLYSSGSTGKPKGVIHLQRNMEAAYENYAKNILKINEDDRTFSAAKLYFAYGLGNGIIFPFGAGGTSILMKAHPNPSNVIQTIEEKKPTIFFGVPTLYGAIINHVEKEGRIPDFSSLRLCASAGEPLPSLFVKKWKELFDVDILDGLGSSEALHIFLSNRSGEVNPGSTGKIVPGYEAKILNEEANQVPTNEIGDLVIKGDSLSSGYWNRLSETKEKFVGEWMYTGDKYYQDEEGYFWYCGRSDDMLKVGGIWVSPTEIENTLIEHEDILEAAVVGAENEHKLAYPKAYVVLHESIEESDELKESLKLFVKERLASYKYPREIEFIKGLPKTATGKIQRFKLKVD